MNRLKKVELLFSTSSNSFQTSKSPVFTVSILYIYKYIYNKRERLKRLKGGRGIISNKWKDKKINGRRGPPFNFFNLS